MMPTFPALIPSTDNILLLTRASSSQNEVQNQKKAFVKKQIEEKRIVHPTEDRPVSWPPDPFIAGCGGGDKKLVIKYHHKRH